MTLLDRYLAGQHADVWDELRKMGPDAERNSVAWEVGLETMRRVLRNVELVVERLRLEGWRFAKKDVYPVLALPDSQTREQIAELEHRLRGPIPLALKAFWNVVGSVSLMRENAGYEVDMSLPDPLVVGPVDHALIELTEWQSDEERQAEPFRAPLAPDVLHKDEISGGLPYEIQLPDSGADAPFLNEPHTRHSSATSG